jgi:hypothetical protein
LFQLSSGAHSLLGLPELKLQILQFASGFPVLHFAIQSFGLCGSSSLDANPNFQQQPAPQFLAAVMYE